MSTAPPSAPRDPENWRWHQASNQWLDENSRPWDPRDELEEDEDGPIGDDGWVTDPATGKRFDQDGNPEIVPGPWFGAANAAPRVVDHGPTPGPAS